MSLKSRLLALSAVLTLALSLSISSAVAAGKGSTGTTGPKITFDRSQVMVGETYYVSGTGFRANTWVTVGAHFPDTIWWNSQVTDAEGRFRLAFTATSAGQIYHEAKEQGNSGRLRVQATGMLTAYAP